MMKRGSPLRVVITGGPAVGKTATLLELGKKYPVEMEAAREVFSNNSKFKGKNSESRDLASFQRAVWKIELKNFREASRQKSKYVFFDRGLLDGFAYSKLGRIKIPKKMINDAKRNRYDYIFVLDPLPFYKKDKIRKESKKEAQKIHLEIINQYKKYGYSPIKVPFDTIKNRARFILEKLKSFKS